MAARKQKFHPQWVRDKIKTAYLIRRLQAHVKGEIVLSATQIRAIDIMLRKVLPDLMQTQVSASVEHKYVVEVPPLLTKDEWSKKYRTPQPPKTLDLTPLPTPPLITKQ